MDISPVISSSIVQADFFGTAGVQPVTFLLNPSATTTANSIDTVDISGLGQLLSSSLIFETNILKAAAANQISFPTVVSATQFFVDAFNSFMQSSSLQSSSGGSLGNLFATMLNTQTSSGDGRSIIASLSGIGINFQASTSQNSPGLMTIDLQTLQSAFNADQLGTVSLLAQTTQSIGQVATEFTSLFVQTNDLTQNSQSSLNAATSNGLLETTAATGTTATTGTTTATTGATTTTIATAATGATVTTATTGTTAATTETNAAAPVTVRLPATATLPTTSAPVTAAPTAIAPTATPQNLFNPIIDASDPAVAAAIAAYHVVDGIFNSSKPQIETSSAFVPGYSAIPPVAPIRPVRLDLYT